MEETITITKAEYDAMQERLAFLDCLECCGVDNWQGYGDAWEMMEEGEEE
jgi:hypothetical protein